MAVEARQERRLRLPDDIAGDPHHHVMEAAVLEVVLDPGAARPRHRAVDHVELAVVGPADLVLAPVDPLAVGVEAVPVGREDVVDDDLGAGGGEAGEHLPRLLVRPGAEPVHDHPDLDALRQLPLQQRRHLIPISPSRQPNIRMCTVDRAASTSAKIFGKKFTPSAHGSIVAAVDHANGSAASRGRGRTSATNASVAACAPADVTASKGGGQLGRCVTPSTRR